MEAAEEEVNTNGTEVRTPAEGTAEPTWWVDEGVPGTGDRPAWLGEKFKSAADLAKSYQDLEKRVGVAPENYDFSKSKFIDGDYVPFQELQDLAKSKRVPAEVMDKMLESVDKYLDEFTPDYAEEAKLLGEDGPARLKRLDNWVKANVSGESFEALTGSLKTASGIKALEELRDRAMSNTVTIPNGNDDVSNVTSLEDLQSELSNNLEKYKTDSKYRSEYQQKLQRAATASNFVDKNM